LIKDTLSAIEKFRAQYPEAIPEGLGVNFVESMHRMLDFG
jgi:hypothetical protein